ncbi:hypothetical protein GDO81_015349 [Engystomops pustulosus]|uniref:Uncharacterized protein n=1 Tax=Engystomops pustulosus TaxID=76066 RepID=A0AAV7ATL8_ENGPU|nr:hypothetical protein GDO81_015349 [Engystomops pustulosus]
MPSMRTVNNHKTRKLKSIFTLTWTYPARRHNRTFQRPVTGKLPSGLSLDSNSQVAPGHDTEEPAAGIALSIFFSSYGRTQGNPMQAGRQGDGKLLLGQFLEVSGQVGEGVKK